MSISCTNGYEGFVPGHLATYGKTFAKGTHEVLRTLGLAGARDKPCTKSCRKGEPCSDLLKDMRAKLHMAQGEIDPNPCCGTEWDINDKFCIQKPANVCEPKLQRMNQHGYLSRLSVYQKNVGDRFGVGACRGENKNLCNAAMQPTPPYFREYEDLTNYDPFQEYTPDCRHLRLPKLKYKSDDICPPKCDPLPLTSTKPDESIKWYRHETDPDSFIHPIFADPTNRYRYFKTGYMGHVPTLKYRFGERYEDSSKKALSCFTKLFMRALLKDRPDICPPEPCCSMNEKFERGRNCIKRNNYDGHFHEQRIRDRLKPVFDPRECVQPTVYEYDPPTPTIQVKNPCDPCDY